MGSPGSAPVLIQLRTEWSPLRPQTGRLTSLKPSADLVSPACLGCGTETPRPGRGGDQAEPAPPEGRHVERDRPLVRSPGEGHGHGF